MEDDYVQKSHDVIMFKICKTWKDIQLIFFIKLRFK